MGRGAGGDLPLSLSLSPFPLFLPSPSGLNHQTRAAVILIDDDEAAATFGTTAVEQIELGVKLNPIGAHRHPVNGVIPFQPHPAVARIENGPNHDKPPRPA